MHDPEFECRAIGPKAPAPIPFGEYEETDIEIESDSLDAKPLSSFESTPIRTRLGRSQLLSLRNTCSHSAGMNDPAGG